MNKISRLILLLCIYASLFIGCFLLITYYNGLYLLENSIVQLIIAIIGLIIGLILIVYQFISKRKDYEKEDLEDDSIDEETEKIVLRDEEIFDDNYEFSDSSEIDLIDENKTLIDEEIAVEDEIVVEEEIAVEDEIVVENEKVAEEEKTKDIIEVLYDTLSMKKIEENKDNEETETSKLQKEIEVEDEHQDIGQAEKQEIHLEMISKDMITEDVVEKVELTDTQMMYIEQSESSYLNTQGLPQLVITNQVDSKDVKRADHVFKEIEKQENIDKQELYKEELKYLKEEKEENIISALSIATAILIFLNIVLIAYYFLLRM
ncbi:MAG: hypothetical protein QM204_03530 [Bacillota bacterium]|jgi:uncharacterized membrane protein|nr:hypothetical protein [Bacillota bacterium]NLL26411.1 hypothetical protein [Erysipelotrichia bacterium]